MLRQTHDLAQPGLGLPGLRPEVESSQNIPGVHVLRGIQVGESMNEKPEEGSSWPSDSLGGPEARRTVQSQEEILRRLRVIKDQFHIESRQQRSTARELRRLRVRVLVLAGTVRRSSYAFVFLALLNLAGPLLIDQELYPAVAFFALLAGYCFFLSWQIKRTVTGSVTKITPPRVDSESIVV